MKISGAFHFYLKMLLILHYLSFNYVLLACFHFLIYSKSTHSATLHKIDKECEKVSFKVILIAL